MKLIDLVPVFGAVVLAILCYVLSGHVGPTASGGLLVLAGALAGWSIPRLSEWGKNAGPIRPKDSGVIDRLAMPIVLGLALGFMFLASIGYARAEAQAPVAPVVSNWSWGPSVASAVGAINLHDGSYTVGPNAVPLGACLGLTYLPLDAGVDGCFNFILANKNAPNLYFPSAMLHLKKYFQAGVGLLARQNSSGDGLYYNVLILLGGRYGFAGG